MEKSREHVSLTRQIAERQSRVYRYLVGRLANEDDAQDLAQEAYLRLLRVSRRTLVQNPQAYLFRIARNLVYEWYARAVPVADTEIAIEDIEDFNPSPDDVAEEAHRLDCIDGALAKLSPKCRAAVLLYWYYGYTQFEIADQLGVSRPMIQKYLATGLSHCQQELSSIVRESTVRDAIR